MSYWVEGDTSGCNVFIVGFALAHIPFASTKLKFLQGVGYAIYAAAFGLDEMQEDGTGDKHNFNAQELDVKVFLPRPIASRPSTANETGYAETVIGN